MKVNTVTVDQVEWLQFWLWLDSSHNVLPLFKLCPKRHNTVVRGLPIPGTVDVTADVGNVVML